MNTNTFRQSLIDAKILKNNDIQRGRIHDNVIEIMREIDDEIKESHREGLHHIVVPIPICFDIPNMTNANAQLAIWSTIIKVLKEKNYRAWINYDKDSCRIKITWISESDESELMERKHILKDASLNF